MENSCIILARISSKEQEQGHSLDAQIDYLTDYAKRNHLKIEKVFSWIESGGQVSRKKFDIAIDYSIKQKIPHILFEKSHRPGSSYQEKTRSEILLHLRRFHL